MHRVSSEKLLESLFDGVYFVDRDRRITYWNAAAERISGYSREEVIGSCCSENLLRHIDAEGAALCETGCPLLATMADGHGRESKLFLHHRLGHRVPVSVRCTPVYGEDGAVVGAVEIFNDNSSSMQILLEYEQLKQDVFTDPLSGIGNRRYAEMSLSTRMYDFKSHAVPFGVLFLDIDHFKQVNDRFGHNIGDQVIVMVAKSIAATLRKIDVAARWGGEEFVVILPGATGPTVASVGERVRTLIESSFIMIGDQKLCVTASVGGTEAQLQDTPETLVERADQLMYRSKQTGRNRVTVEDQVRLD